MRLALEDADLTLADVDYVNAHATSTPAGDPSEARAIRAVFGAHADRLAVSATKSMTGHLLGAAGAVEALLCIRALESGILPPTINLDDVDPDCELDHVANAGAPGRHPGGALELVRLRRHQRLPGVRARVAEPESRAASRRERAASGARAWRASRGTTRGQLRILASRPTPWATRSSSPAITAAPSSRPRCANASRRRATRSSTSARTATTPSTIPTSPPPPRARSRAATCRAGS